MANTLTPFIKDLNDSLDTVSRELTGMVGAVRRDSNAERAAVGQDIDSFVAPAAVATDITPAVAPPDDGDQTLGNKQISITKARRVPFRYNGEEELGLNNSGLSPADIRQNQMKQAMRTLINEMEADLTGLYVDASRATGVAGTTPFVSDLSESAEVLQILLDNGAPQDDLQLVIGTGAGANLRTLTQLSKANEAGGDDLLRRGVLLDVHGFKIRESAQIKSHTKGTGTGYLVNNSPGPYAVGATSIDVDTGSNTILAGDVVTAAGDTNKYINGTALSGGVIVLNEPGLRETLADGVALTVGNNYVANMAFARSAIALATRAPALPDGGDLAVDRIMITDPITGLSFEVAIYEQYRQLQYELSAAWGFAAMKDEHIAIMLG